MNDDSSSASYTSFLGTGWSFPPEFVVETGQLVLTSDEADIHASLKILLGTLAGERFLNPKYGLDMHEMVFESLSTTMKTFLKDRVRTSLLIYEPRINLISLELDTTAELEGVIRILVEYEIRATNSRYNLVYPFYTKGGNEVRGKIDFQKP
jgi:phage baseplate assembly protein W